MPGSAAPRIVACAVLLALAPAAAAVAGPLDAAVSEAERPGLFERLFDRRDYIRRSAPLRRPAETALDEAARARRAAADARRAADLQPLRPPPLAPAPASAGRLEDAEEERRRLVREVERARQRAGEARLQRFLDGAARADRAAVEAGIATARAARLGTIARGLDRLQAGAAAEWSELGNRPTLGPRPLITMPRVEAD